MKRAIAAILLCVSLFILVSSVCDIEFRWVKAVEDHVSDLAVEVTPEFPSTYGEVNSTVSFWVGYSGYNVSFGSLVQVNNTFFVEVVVIPPPGVVLPIVIGFSQSYSLGVLSEGSYNFTALVTVMIPFPPGPDMIIEQDWVSEVFTVMPILVVPDDHPIIQEAINAAVDGDTIFVRIGTYYENVVVNKGVLVIGESKETTIIDGDGTPYAFTVIANNVTIRGFTIVGGIGLYSYGNEVSYNVIMEGADTDGIYLYRSHENLLEGNYVTRNRCGIFFSESGNNTVIGNQITENRYWGMEVWGLEANNNVIAFNNVSSNGFDHLFGGLDGIYIDLSSDNRIYDNVVIGNARDGITLSRSGNNSIHDNVISGNEGRAGVFLSSWEGRNATDNRIFANDIARNEYGIYLDRSNGNFFYHNSFVNNTNQLYLDSSLNNTWDNGCEGNHWSDYETRYPNASYDTFGIWNTSYVIDGNNQDNYPLRNLFWNPADIDHDLKVDIFDIVKCAACYCIDWEEHFCHVDITEPFGIVDIYDIVMICSSYGKEYTP